MYNYSIIIVMVSSYLYDISSNICINWNIMNLFVPVYVLNSNVRKSFVKNECVIMVLAFLSFLTHFLYLHKDDKSCILIYLEKRSNNGYALYAFVWLDWKVNILKISCLENKRKYNTHQCDISQISLQVVLMHFRELFISFL